MDLDRLQSDLQRLAEIVGGWDASKEIDALERDLVLEKLRGLYETVRFGTSVRKAPAVEEKEAAPEAAPLDLGAVLSLDPLSGLSVAPDVHPEREESSGETLHEVSEPEIVTMLEEAAVQTAEAEVEPASESGEEPVPDEAKSASDVAEPAVSDESRPEAAAAEPAAAPEQTVADTTVAPEQTVAESTAVPEQTVSEPVPVSGSAPAAPAETEPAVHTIRESAGDAGSSAVEAFVAASVAESEREEEAVHDGEEHARERSASQTLFGVEEASSRHRHKQRVIMSLYGSEVPERHTSGEESHPTPATAEPEVRPAAPAAAPAAAKEPAAHSETPLHSETPAASGAVLGEVINPNVHTLADTIAPPHDIASELRRSEPVTDLHRAIGINDKFLMIRDLFGGDGAAFERAIDALNGFDNLDDCMIYVAENYAWNANSDGAKLLMDLLERKFA